MNTTTDSPRRSRGHGLAIRPEEVERHLQDGRDFIDDEAVTGLLRARRRPAAQEIREIMAQALALQRLQPVQTAALLNVEDPELWNEIFAAARDIKEKVYGPRVVTFAPLYCSNLCLNSCLYCGFRRENAGQQRRRLTLEEVRAETSALIAGGHKRLIVVYGEHPLTDVHYIAGTIEAIYGTRLGNGEIRRVNVNAAPLCVDDYRILREIGIGTYQVFQETYHHETYRRVHPRGIKADYRWRLYALHRAQEAGVDDVAIGALFGLYDWKFEVLGLLMHAIDLEQRFGGVGPHTISFPRLEPAAAAPLTTAANPHRVSDEDFRRLVAVLRLSVPYTGMIVTAREPAAIRREALSLGCTQTDASSRIGIGAYSDRYSAQELQRQQFMLGDTRSLDEVVRELAQMGLLTSFCTAGYRCGRTGASFMQLARAGKVHEFCIPNALLTFKEYLVDYASPETRAVGEPLILRHLARVNPHLRPKLAEWLQAIENGARDLRF
jgi:2-iminoacetate synthase